jgi:tetratricopeptide (TPR) repeat protein
MHVFAYGRLYTIPSRTWERVLRQRGDERSKRARGADLVVVGAGAASRPKLQITEDLREFRETGQLVVSERRFLRSIGLLSPPRAEARTFSAADIAARAKLEPDLLDLLAVFDVVEPDEADRYGFRDLKAAMQAGRLLQSTGLAELVYACSRMRESLGAESPLSELNVQCDSLGNIVLAAGDRKAEVTGQVLLDLDHTAPTVVVLLANAEEAREAGNTDYAVQLLRQALHASPKDLDTLFELGSLLCEQDHFAEGVALLRKAAVLRPRFAEAWYNIGHALERQGRRDDARKAYEDAAAADPGYADPLYNLGMLDLDAGRFSAAVHRFEAYLAIDTTSAWALKARKALALARMSLVRAG